MKKQDILALLEEQPDDVDLDELLYTLHVREKIQKGLEDIAAGRVYTQEEVERLSETWLK